MTGVALDVGYSSAGCAVLVAIDEHVYAMTYGAVGRHMIDLDRAERTFGISFAIRALKPAQIKRLTRHVLAATGRVDRNAVPGGQHIRSYIVEPWGEIVGQLCGQLNNERLTVSPLHQTTGNRNRLRRRADRAEHRPGRAAQRPARDQPGVRPRNPCPGVGVHRPDPAAVSRGSTCRRTQRAPR